MLAFKSYLVTQQMQTQELPGAIQESCDLGKKAESLEGWQNHRTAQVGGDHERITLSNPSWERERGLSSTVSKHIMTTSSEVFSENLQSFFISEVFCPAAGLMVAHIVQSPVFASFGTEAGWACVCWSGCR